ncbi:MAG: CRTAC1 family protein [Acidobacteria bacterium]|nr:CRTAC1 family protein [Acidobacteriota bacterium]
MAGRTHARSAWWLAAFALAACTNVPADPGSAAADGVVPAPEAAPGPDDWFVERAAASGLDFVHFNGMSGEFYAPEMMPAGVGLLDYDNDGDLDAYFVQGQIMGDGKALADALFEPPGPLPPRGRLFRNDLDVGADGIRTLRFTDVTAESGIDARGHGMGAAAGDVDNDGDVDLYLANLGPNRLYRNDGDGTFTDVSAASGTDDPGWGVSASFVDVDRDGWLDLYVGNYLEYDFDTDPHCTGLTGRRVHCGPKSFPAQADRLYRNRGDGTFADVTADSLGREPPAPALGIATADFDDDGWIDIYVANDQVDNVLWMNDGDGTFTNRARLSGTAVSADGRPEASMGVDAGDFDNDGDEDLTMTHLPREGHNLYRNDGGGLFEDWSAPSGYHAASFGYSGWGTAWIDVDNDGWLDIVVANGAIEPVPGPPGDPLPFDERNLLFRNEGGRRLVDVTDRAGAAFELLEVSRGAAFGDVDNDGDTDVLLSNLAGPARLLINNAGNRSHWLGLRLVGAGGRDMLGSRVRIERAGEPTLWRRARSDGSYASANDPRVLVGLGASDAPATVHVQWPDGAQETWTGVAADRWTTLAEGTGASR